MKETEEKIEDVAEEEMQEENVEETQEVEGQTSDRMEGTVKWFNQKKGYGFIQGEDGQDYFVHYTTVEKETFLRENDKVSFEPVQTDRGKQAKDVRLI